MNESRASQMRVCATCGVLWAAGFEWCTACRGDQGPASTSSSVEVPREDEVFWVRIKCAFKCRSCGFVVPLNHLDMDGTVLCMRCGLEQAFEVDLWKQALALAHAAGELFEETAESSLRGALVAAFENAGIVHTAQTSIQVTLAGENRLAVTASPGSPRCDGCHGPLDLAFGSGRDGPATVSCAACNASAVYQIPDAARRMDDGALRVAIASEHRTDQAAVKTTGSSTGGAVAIQCPSCGGPLSMVQKTRFTKCPHCGTESRIPDHTWFHLSGREPENAPIWLLFRGHSRTYAAAVSKQREEALADQEKKARSAARAATQTREQEDLRRAKEASLSFRVARRLARSRTTVLIVVILGISVAALLARGLR